jgi:ABC-type dipeptide/oligopeptide/nickel transport system ATPase component
MASRRLQNQARNLQKQTGMSYQQALQVLQDSWNGSTLPLEHTPMVHQGLFGMTGCGKSFLAKIEIQRSKQPVIVIDPSGEYAKLCTDGRGRVHAAGSEFMAPDGLLTVYTMRNVDNEKLAALMDDALTRLEPHLLQGKQAVRLYIDEAERLTKSVVLRRYLHESAKHGVSLTLISQQVMALGRLPRIVLMRAHWDDLKLLEHVQVLSEMQLESLLRMRVGEGLVVEGGRVQEFSLQGQASKQEYQQAVTTMGDRLAAELGH